VFGVINLTHEETEVQCQSKNHEEAENDFFQVHRVPFLLLFAQIVAHLTRISPDTQRKGVEPQR
jgi:hypothetical protein